MSSINLDRQNTTDLMVFWNKHQSGRCYRDLFPEGGKGAKRATADLANYAANKAAAQTQRALGRISIAIYYENICDYIYEQLPDYARW